MPSTSHTTAGRSPVRAAGARLGTVGDPARARATARTVFHPTTWRDVVRLDLSRASGAAALWVGATVGLVLLTGGLLGYRDIAGFAALGAVISAFCRADPDRVRAERLITLAGALIATVAAGAGLGIAQMSVWSEVVVISAIAGAASLLVTMLHITGPGAVVFVFAATGAAGYAHTGADLGRLVGATAIGAVCGVAASMMPWLGRALTGLLRRDAAAPPAGGARPVAYESVWRSLARRPHADQWHTALRIAVAGSISGAIAAAAGLTHPMWAAMGAVAAIQGVRYHVTVQRGVSRLLGNVGGAAIAAGLLAMPLGYWWSVVAIIGFQALAEAMAPVNYTITSLAITPMALLLTALGASMAPGAAVDRVLDTLVGIVVGIVIAALTISGHDLEHLAARHR